jgi:uncharacterized protein (DUF1015 family)
VAALLPLRAIRYEPEHVRLGGVLAPPYDVITAAQREALYGRDLRNIVRIDFGRPYPEDRPGASDVYTRAAEHLRSWLELGVLVRDEAPGLYLVAHEFEAPGDGGRRRRLGLLGRVPALPWERSQVRPHERTLRGPKEDRLALMRATGTQTSPVWVLWDGAPGLRHELEGLVTERALLGGRYAGEGGPEKLLVWRIDDAAALERIERLLAPATLYVADGHHRFETAAAYAEERRAAGDAEGADSQHVLVYASAVDDPALLVLPIHRIVLPRAGPPSSRDEILGRLDPAWEMEPVDDPLAELSRLEKRHPSQHACVAVTARGTAILHRPRREGASPRATLDVAVLQEEVIAPCGIGEAELREGAVEYTRDPAEAVAAVREGRAPLALLLAPCTPREVVAVADAGETMPQKSTYFYPKVPTGLVLSPL